MSKILIVDDMKPIQVLLKRRLEKEKHDVIVTNNGKEAYTEIINSEDIDLIFLDIMMPGQNGIEFLEKHFNECRDKNIKVCMLTALEDNDNIQKCLKLGAIDYLVKPIDNELLLEKLDALLNDNPSGRFAAIKTLIPAIIELNDMIYKSSIIVLSENRTLIESKQEFITQEIIQISSPHLDKLIGDIKISARIIQLKKDKDSFVYLCEFIGLSEKKTSKIRELTVSGKEIIIEENTNSST
ncbi:MAG: response regulator [Bacteriovoracaceae bacterium]|jgi:DNA-binding response OmpR family regulator|nr:response regulator [Bacteriovoracaceae bacterium]